MARTINIGAVTLNDVEVKINGNIVSMVQQVKVEMKKDQSTLYQAGDYGEPAAFIQTKKSYKGSIDRTFVDRSLIDLLTPLSGDFPEFSLSGTVKSDLTRGEPKNFTVLGCLCEGFELELTLESETKTPLSFNFKRFQWD